MSEEFYDVYTEAKHRTREDIEREMAEISRKIQYEEMTEAEWLHYTNRLGELYEMLRLKDIEDRNRENRLLNSYGRWLND